MGLHSLATRSDCRGIRENLFDPNTLRRVRRVQISNNNSAAKVSAIRLSVSVFVPVPFDIRVGFGGPPFARFGSSRRHQRGLRHSIRDSWPAVQIDGHRTADRRVPNTETPWPPFVDAAAVERNFAKDFSCFPLVSDPVQCVPLFCIAVFFVAQWNYRKPNTNATCKQDVKVGCRCLSRTQACTKNL